MHWDNFFKKFKVKDSVAYKTVSVTFESKQLFNCEQLSAPHASQKEGLYVGSL
jgi:hypothetical protein